MPRVSSSAAKFPRRASSRKRTTRDARQMGERAHALDTRERLKVIARAAYLRAQRTGFELGAFDDGLAAELEMSGIHVERSAEDDLH
jgi:hypothetical protein